MICIFLFFTMPFVCVFVSDIFLITSSVISLIKTSGHYLNPKYFYTNPLIENDDQLLDGLYKCIKKLSISTEVVDAIHGELTKYRDCDSHFRLSEALRQRDAIAPAEWWKRFGSKTPNLQLLAIKILSLTCSSSGCERNWSTFELIHSKRRNRLEHEMLQNLVFIKYNQTIIERYESDDKIDPVIMDDNFASNEWELGDECQGDQNDVVFDNDDLSWLDVEVASGVAEPIVNTRSQAALPKAAAPTPPPRTKSLSSKGKAKEVVEVDEYDPKFVDNWEDEEKEDEEEEIEEKEDEEEHMHNSSGGGSDDEDFVTSHNMYLHLCTPLPARPPPCPSTIFLTFRRARRTSTAITTPSGS